MLEKSTLKSSRRGINSSPPSMVVAFALLCLMSLFNDNTSMFVKAQETSAFGTYGWENLHEQCKYQLFPISSGGSKDEKVSCTVFDPVNQFIIVAGNSTSEDYAPAANDHAFAYAVDLEGNWKWGKFFYNVSYAVSTISGCHMDDNNNLVFLGQGDSMPVIMEMNTIDGTILKFMSIEQIGSSDTNVPWYMTYGAIHHDVADQDDGLPYYYVSFIMKDYLQVLKINRDTQEIIWNYQYIDDDATDVYLNYKIPGFLHQDKNDPGSMYLIGRFQSYASVIKFSKNNFNLDWKTEVRDFTTGYVAQDTKMSEILSVVQPPKNDFLWCAGYAYRDNDNPSNRIAVVMKMDDDGDIKFVKQWGDYNADPTTLTVDDVARAINFDEQRKEIVVLMEVHSTPLRPDYKGYSDCCSTTQSDLLIIRMKESGKVMSGYNINFYDADISMLVGDNSMFIYEDYYIFGGQSWGFNTKQQNVTYEVDNPVYNSYVFKYDYSKESYNDNCFYQAKLSRSDLEDSAVYVEYDDDDTQSKTNGKYLFSQMNNLFLGYESRYSGAFDLQDTFKTNPRMCALATSNLTTGVNYYRGKYPQSYIVSAESSDGNKIINNMDSGKDWIFQNGTSAALLGNYSEYDNGGTFYIETSNEDDVGKHRTILRGCSRLNNLVETYLYVEVYNNKYPDFINDIQESFEVDPFEVFEYQLPQVEDAEQGDAFYTGTPEVYIESDLDPENEFPPFMSYNNITRTLTFRPDSQWYQGKEWKFRVVLKESDGSDSVMYAYPCTVKVKGEILDLFEELEFTDFTFEMEKPNRSGETSITWSNPVNTTFITENWDGMFDVYIKNVTIRDHNQSMPVLAWDHTGFSEDLKTMFFKVRFHDPYMLGLLTKKSDRLYVHLKYDLLDMNGWFKEENKFYRGMFLDHVDPEDGILKPANATLQRLFPEECQKDADLSPPINEDAEFESTKNREKLYVKARIDLQFDFENTEMMYMRQFAVKTYWYLCGIVLFQFLMLAVRNIGFLPLWTLIEYMQLCAFIPLYNFRMIPYLYDAFKPFLVSHLVLTNDPKVLVEMENDFFNINYDYFGLSVAKLGQALALISALACVVIACNIIVFVVWIGTPKESSFGKMIGGVLKQFRFNAYIRFYMLSYFDLTFFAVMKYVEGNTTTKLRQIAEVVSYIIIVLSAVMPLLLMTIVCRRYEVMKIKQAKESFNTVVLKIDKQSRWRLVVPGYFFFRRLLTACLLSMPIDNTFIFLQYVFILMSSHAYVLYLVAIKPYQSPLLNNYVLSNETFYSALIIAIFIFSDATPELHIKLGAAIVLMTSIFLLIFANFLMIVILFIKGRDKIKEEIKQSKLKRAEKELMEEEEEEERRQRQKREEEEFTKLPEDTTQMSHYDLNARTDGPTPDGEETVGKPTKKRKGKKNKKKGDNDELQAFDMNTGSYTTAMGDTTTGLNDTDAPLKGKKRKEGKKKRKDKHKNKGDDLQDIEVEGPDEEVAEDQGPSGSSDTKGKKTKGSSDDPSGSSSSDKKKGKKKEENGDDNVDNDGNLI